MNIKKMIDYVCLQMDPSALLDDHGSTVRAGCGPTNGSEMFSRYYNENDGGAKSPCGVKIENL